MTKYRPEILQIAELSSRSGISQRTIYRFIKYGLDYERQGGKILIDINQFLNYVHKHYRYKHICLRHGKRWEKDELSNPVGRTSNAIRLKIYRDNKQ